MKIAMVKGREMSYAEYIRSDEWAGVRKRYKQSGMKKNCYCCDAHDIPLDHHHKSYKRLGHERLHDLCRVCRSCHERIHRMVKETGMSIWEATKRVRRIIKRNRKRKS